MIRDRRSPSSNSGRWFPMLLVGLASGAVSFLIPSSAQTLEGVDVDRLRKEAKERQKDLSAFTRDVSDRANALQADALGTREGADRNAERAAEMVGGMSGGDPMGIDEMLAQSGTVRSGGAASAASGPAFIAFASTSMPPAALKQMIRDVSAAGGTIVFRGFPNNSVRQFGAVMVQVLDKGQSTRSMGVDPRLFRAFHVQSVPTYVVTSNEVTLCDGFACVSDVPPHDRLEGNVTAEHALTTFAAGGGPGSAAARVYLRRLEAGKAAS